MTRPKNSCLDIDDMPRWRLTLRMTLDREHRRFHKANDMDFFEDQLKTKLSSNAPVKDEGVSTTLVRLDEAGFTNLNNFLTTVGSLCTSSEQQNKFQEVLRNSMVDIRRRLYEKGKLDEFFCLFCGIAPPNQPQHEQQRDREPVQREPTLPLQNGHHYTPNMTEATATPPASMAPTPDIELHETSLQRLQSQFNNSFTRSSMRVSSTPPLSPNQMAAMRLRQNLEAQAAVNEARASQSNASPMGLVNFNQQANNLNEGHANDDANNDNQDDEVASVRDIVERVDRVMGSPRRNQHRSSTPLSSASSSDLVMDISADADTSQSSEPSATLKRIREVRERAKNPRKPRIKRGGKKRASSSSQIY